MKRAGVKTAMVVGWLLGVIWSPSQSLGQCCGDCNGDGEVTVDELVTAVNRALTSCSDDGCGDACELAICNGNLNTCNGSLTNCNGTLTACNGSLTTCNGNLSTCNGSLSTCTINYTSCQNDLATCDGDYATCTTSLNACNGNSATCTSDLNSCKGNYATCSGDLTTCNTTLDTVNTGTAAAGDVLAGKTFSSGAGLAVSGAMPNVGQQNVMPGTAPVTIIRGYHDGTGTVAGDADLVADNIKDGVDIFGVTGTLSPSVLVQSGQTTAYGTGSDGDIQAGVVPSYTDNGDGTITDNNTGLMWEKKDQRVGGIHNQDNTYSWGLDSAPYTMNGTMVTKFLNTLNNHCADETTDCTTNGDADCTGNGNGKCGFAGYRDWRIPNVRELESLLDYQNVGPAVDPAFNTSCAADCMVTSCSCTQFLQPQRGGQGRYWSSTTAKSSPAGAWVVYFHAGGLNAFDKSIDNSFVVRAVRDARRNLL